ncbi:MAG: peptidase domain-containing ABC transporter [Bacilli bacterium]|nr:peptidase domain-containing ABC transporter [Bacilli bacterium]
MIIKYYGGYVKKNTLLEMTKTSKSGTTAYHLKETLKQLGFEAKGVSCKLDDINQDNIILPCIANVIIDDSYKHFIVIYEINFKKKYLIIGDPANKIKKISYKEFDKIYNNVLVTFYPIKKLPTGKDINLFQFIIHIIKPHKKLLINIFILSIFITLFSILTSFYTEYMINGINFYSKTHILLIFYIFFLIHILKIISDFFRNKSLAYINQKLDLELTLDIYNKIIKLPYCYYKNRTTGDIISRMNDLNNVREMISKVALSLFVDLPLTIISLIVLFLINRTLFMIGVAILILYFIIIVLFRGCFNDYIKKIQVKKSESTSYMVESISGFETVKGINLESSIIDKFEKKYVKLLKDVFKYENLYFLQNLFKEIVNNIGFIFITLVGCILVIEGKMEIGSLFTFSSLLVYFLEPIKNIINLDSTIKEAKHSLKRVLELVAYPKKESGVINKFKCGNIDFKNLSFSFNDRDYILKNVNLSIDNKSKVMVVGKSGSGKSTLFKLLMKYHNIKNNKIFINNVDLNNLKENVVKENILYLGQNEILFNDTLYNNLIFDNSDSSKLLDVSKMCCLDEVMDSNLGFNMLIEENGFNLSGGEKQRIVLARTLLKKFEILIIDEGLSQVDVNLERKILKNIFKYFKDKTIIMISHRLDNLDLFDNLVRIENGVVNDVRKNG